MSRPLALRPSLVLAALLVALPALAAPPATLRLDFYHTGNARQELFSLDRLVVEPLPWPGNPDRPLDDTDLGKYRFEVLDAASGRVVYSRGFASIYGEWETTGEAAAMNRTFHESLRFPLPEAPVRVVVSKRDSANAWRAVWRLDVDPADPFVDRARRAAPADLVELERHGDPAHKVDLLILGDGYRSDEQDKFRRDARRLLDTLFATEPFKARRADFNVWGLCPPALESGISRPSEGIHRHNPLGSTYDAFGSERYILTFDNRAFRETAAFAPYDFVEILVNGRTYGGGGIFGLYSTVAADNDQAPYVFIHELGHHLAALADEYYTSPVAYLPAATRTEPWEPNVTALLDPATLKWKDLVAPGTPLPTPWQKEAYEANARAYAEARAALRREARPEAEMEELFRRLRRHDLDLFRNERYAGRVGAFEGALYEARGYFRPQVDCIMFSRSPDFCAVCRRAITRVVDLYARP